MGVQGLASFVEKHPKVYREVQFNRSRLVIDGCNLNYLLYFGSGLDQNHGGEYAAYENLIERFITALRTCEISPYVVLDGGSDVTDKKVETVAKRTEDRVKRAHIAAVTGKRMSVLPRMADLVFRQTLARLQVPVAQCFEEADREIAALAAEWRCPVLSYDSDFYIFDLPGGLLPYTHFHWKEVKQSGSLSFIPCRRYYSSSFCIFFGLQPQLLPTFAALAGNDYVKLKVVKWDDFAPPGTETPSRLEGLLCWLKNFEETQEALEAALVLMGVLNENKREVLQRLHLGMEDYQLRPTSLNRFFLHGVPPEIPALDEEADLVPNWMLLPLTQARLSSHILDVLRLQQMGLGFSIEHEKLPSANLISRPVRQVLYGLLLGRRKPNLVDEIDRDGLEVTSIKVKPILTRTSKKLVRSSLHEAELSDRLQVLLEALEVTEESLSRLPPELKLPAAVTCYWLQKAQPTPDRTMLKALLLGMCNRSTLKFTAALHKNSSKQRMDISAAYVFNQWQASLKHSIHLNQLLGFPLPDPRVA
ncbi:PREDICTED: protein asteroid homolog 1-like, partial [Cyprinodon variegatus]|uniref:protein asteroid homolog 1-like n=1 Tax=Cyprinodon variegatus TaxID=28743 RepID=UPI0007429334